MRPTLNSPVARSVALVGLFAAAGLCACSDEPEMPAAPASVEVLPVQGVAIDGSDDVQELPEPAAESSTPSGEGAVAADPKSAADASDGGAAAIENASGGDVLPIAENLTEELTGAALEEAKAEVMSKMVALPESDSETESEIDFDTDGPISIRYRDLTLIDYDVDAMLDYMLFPEEYEGEETQDLQFPPDIRKLNGKVVSIVGYMIPGEMDQGNVRDFMLVRDLLGCCFGGTPMPDEWLDVIMEEDAEAVYRPYMPTRVTGVLTLGGDQDEAGFALGVYKLKGTKVTVED